MSGQCDQMWQFVTIFYTYNVLAFEKFIYLLWQKNLAIFAKMLTNFSSEHLVTLCLVKKREEKRLEEEQKFGPECCDHFGHKLHQKAGRRILLSILDTYHHPFFFSSAFLRNCFLCWDHVSGDKF